MHLITLLPVLLALLATSLADVSITAPKGGSLYTASGSPVEIKIEWEDDGASDATSLDDVKSYTISLCAGSNSAIQCFKQYLKAGTVTDNLYTASILLTDAPNGNFFFQILALFPTGQSIHYSSRFTLSGMSGSSTTQVLNGTPVTLVLDDAESAPTPQINIGGDGSGSIDTRSFTVPYTMQTGKTRYAPMQSQPGSTVTMTTWSRQFPTSSVLYALTFLLIPSILTTITPGWSYTMKSAPNWASVAPYPNNWYPPNQRVTSATLSSEKHKRWQ